MKRAWVAIALAACGGGLIHVKETKPVVVTGTAPAAADPPPEKPPEKITVKQDRIEVNEIIQFEPSSWKVTKDSHAILDELGKALAKHPEIKRVRIEGHTDNQGDAAHNLSLSRKRANNIMKYLVETAGVEAKRLAAEGYGNTKPVANNDTDEGRAKNRRVVFVIVERAAEAKPDDGGE